MGLSKKPNIKELKRKSDVDELINALGDGDAFVRRSAANALGQIGDARAIEPLITALGDEGARGRAAIALGEIGDPAVELLITVFGDESKDVSVRWSAAIVLGKIGDIRAVPVFGKAINNSDERIRNAAKEAIDKIKSSNVYNRHLEEVSRKEKAKNNALKSLEYAYSSLEKAKKLGISTKWGDGS